MDQHGQRAAGDADDRDIADEIEVEVVIQRCADGAGGVGPEERIAIGRSAHDRRRLIGSR
jgi:hypothetical protein